ncbi:response regulator [Sphingobium boeckii]|uniref:DNA-binding NtrC family response regulator n=1 Tax=Sphingobium boeckii TaxID=1082345 RepID=A0A7W9AKX4_9SPHN|nr:response regulator [Sphingobium boeckii]MBB5687342.1 DNA-binding NtrC family response regulator [Sphingobium boeckii]
MSNARRILIVEDEPLIAMMIEDFVELLGHGHAGTADCVETALGLVAADEFDLCILDVNLRGGERSWPVADALAAAGKPFILATGGSGETTPDAHAGAPTLSKPFTMDAVKDALQRIIG